MSNQNSDLERFKLAAQQELESIVMDSAIQARILFHVQETKITPWYRSRGMQICYLSCALLLLVIGITSMTDLFPSSVSHTPKGMISAQTEPGKVDAVTLSADLSGKGTLQELTKLSPFNVQPYSEGFAAAQNEQGLWGFIDKNGSWVVEPVYDEVSGVKDGKAWVKKEGHETFIPVKSKD